MVRTQEERGKRHEGTREMVKRQEARDKRQETRGKRQEARGKRQELVVGERLDLLGHEVLEQRLAGLAVQVAAVLGRVADDAVHLEQLLACDGVGDQGCLVERLVVRALRLQTVRHLRVTVMGLEESNGYCVRE